jgi:hypothetical protein
MIAMNALSASRNRVIPASSREATNRSAWYVQYAESSRSKKFFLQYPGQNHP